MSKRIQRRFWRSWRRNLYFTAFNITSHYGSLQFLEHKNTAGKQPHRKVILVEWESILQGWATFSLPRLLLREASRPPKPRTRAALTEKKASQGPIDPLNCVEGGNTFVITGRLAHLLVWNGWCVIDRRIKKADSGSVPSCSPFAVETLIYRRHAERYTAVSKTLVFIANGLKVLLQFFITVLMFLDWFHRYWFQSSFALCFLKRPIGKRVRVANVALERNILSYEQCDMQTIAFISRHSHFPFAEEGGTELFSIMFHLSTDCAATNHNTTQN